MTVNQDEFLRQISGGVPTNLPVLRPLFHGHSSLDGFRLSRSSNLAHLQDPDRNAGRLDHVQETGRHLGQC